MLTVDFNRFTLGPGMTVLDVGCGQGRHSFEALRRGADVTAFDFSQSDLDEVQTMFDAMAAEGQVPASGAYRTVQGDARAMPFDDASFERVIACSKPKRRMRSTPLRVKIEVSTATSSSVP